MATREGLARMAMAADEAIGRTTAGRGFRPFSERKAATQHPTEAADPAATALFLGAFFDELTRWGVHDVVVSPGSRSTPLAMCAYELACREPSLLRLFVDVDERGAAFFALGLAKASGRPVACVCTSGTAVANYYPAVMEAESSRVPLVVLTGDRPPRLQGLGAPQTCDQLKAFGDHVRTFRQMPLPFADEAALAFARQAAREACIAAGGETISREGANGAAGGSAAGSFRIAGTCFGGPVHLNFPFEEPLKPDFATDGVFEAKRRDGIRTSMEDAQGPIAVVRTTLASSEADRIERLLAGCRTFVLAGEGTCVTEVQARIVLDWARAQAFPVLADPLSGLRCFADEGVIDCYDSVIGTGGVVDDSLMPDAIIRFGRYPVSKKATQLVAACGALQVVVDPLETRDFNAATDLLVRCTPSDFAQSLLDRLAVPTDACSEDTNSENACVRDMNSGNTQSDNMQLVFADAWMRANATTRHRIKDVSATNAADPVSASASSTLASELAFIPGAFEGAYVRRLVELAPKGSCLFAANSMSIRALDTFFLADDKRLTVLCNRGLNGIDGTVSTALGAAQEFAQTTLLIGDLALIHDLNALALQRELHMQCQRTPLDVAPSIVIVLLNNNGGGIFDMLPQQSKDPYFERLFLTPQDVDFKAVARAFDVPYQTPITVDAFGEAYRETLGVPGISLIEVRVPLSGLKDRYAPYW